MTCDKDEIHSKFQTNEEEAFELFEKCYIRNMERYDPAELKALFEVVPNELSNPSVDIKIKWYRATFAARQAETFDYKSEQTRLFGKVEDIYGEILESPETDRMDPLLRPKVRFNLARIKSQTGEEEGRAWANQEYRHIIKDLRNIEINEELSVEVQIARLVALAHQNMGSNYTAKPLPAYREAIVEFEEGIKQLEKFLPEAKLSAREDLLDELTNRFSRDELKTICFRIGVDPENVRAEGLEDFARELILLLERERQEQGILDLLAAVKRARPDSQVFEAVEKEYKVSPLARTQIPTGTSFDLQVIYYDLQNNRALAYHKSGLQGGTKKAIQLLQDVVSDTKKKDYPEGQAYAYGSLAEVYADAARLRLEDAEESFKEAMRIAQQHGYHDFIHDEPKAILGTIEELRIQESRFLIELSEKQQNHRRLVL